MLNIKVIPSYIIADLKKRGHSEADIQQMEPKQAFMEYCRWNGFGDWGSSLWNATQTLQAAEASSSSIAQ